MEQVIWVEQLTRQGEVVMRTRCAGSQISVGRAYDNDVIIDDPRVAAHHILVTRESESGLIATDLGSKNGFYQDGESGRRGSLQLNGDTVIRMGDTYLRVRTPDYPVLPESDKTVTGGGWVKAGILFGLLVIYALFGEWMAETKQFRIISYAGYLFSLCLFLIIWTGGWAILSRIFGGAACFGRQLQVTILLIFATSFVKLVSTYGPLAIESPAINKFSYILFWAIVGLFCFFHLRIMGRSRPILKGGVAAMIALTVITAHSMIVFGSDAPRSSVDYIRGTAPNFVRLVAPKTEGAFWTNINGLQRQVDENRKIPPTDD